MDIECTSHISIVLAICTLKINKFRGGLTKFWQEQTGSFFGTPWLRIKGCYAKFPTYRAYSELNVY